MSNYEEIKGALRLRMYNANKELDDAVIKRDAAAYGFDGLVVVPVMELETIGEGMAISKIVGDMLREWAVDEDTVFEDALANMENDYIICNLNDMMMKIMGLGEAPEPTSEIPEELGEPPVILVSNRNMMCGAAAIIPATAKLIKRFPLGYTVVPSSIHEVLVIPNGQMSDEELNGMVRDVNANVLAEADYLSDDVYVFEA